MGIGNIANTGMKSAMSDMEVISNNISNANTVGYKASHATFGDVYPSVSGGSHLQAGLGVQLTGIKQDFQRGGIELTGNALDLMIGGDGFFALKDKNTGQTSYTRAGRLDIDNDGYIGANNLRLQGFPAANGVIVAGGSLSDIQVSSAPRNATATANLGQSLNLDSSSAVPSGVFNPNDTSTYNYKSENSIFDSLGNKHSLSLYYIKTAANAWDVNVNVDGTSIATGSMTFGANGQLASTTGLSGLSFNPGSGAATPQAFAVSMTGSTQFSSANEVRKVTQDGYTVGKLNGYEIDRDGQVIATYSNDERVLVGKIAIAQFQSPEGLSNIGNMSWLESSESGSPIINPSTSNGNINSGALELSNVDLTQEMINLIGAQHNFQANAQVEQTYNEVMQTVIKI